jgi:hypothetical protein
MTTLVSQPPIGLAAQPASLCSLGPLCTARDRTAVLGKGKHRESHHVSD